MIERLINECEQALEHDLFFAALTLALTLPDICAKAHYPNGTNNKKRYVDWYEEYIGQYDRCATVPVQNDDMPYLSGEVIYSLRCSMLHQGTPNVNEDNCNLTKFELIVEKKNPLGIYSCNSYGLTYRNDEDEGRIITSREIRLNIRNLCSEICEVAKQYYDENEEKFNFFNYHLIDWNEVMEWQIRIGNLPPNIEHLDIGDNDDET